MPVTLIPPSDPAAGEAALLLVESLIHGLIAASILPVADAIELVDAALAVGEEMAQERGETVAGHRTLALLDTVARSLRADLAAAPL